MSHVDVGQKGTSERGQNTCKNLAHLSSKDTRIAGAQQGGDMEMI